MPLAVLIDEIAGRAALAAFALAGGLSLAAGVEPLYAVVRGIAAFLGVLIVCRWLAGLCQVLTQEIGDDQEQARGRGA